MRVHFLCLTALVALLLAGCESLSSTRESVSERWSARYEGKSKAFATDQRTAHAAAKYAASQLGFRVTKGGPAQGVLEAVSGVESDSSLQGSRQVTIKLRITPEGDGVLVNLLLTEVVADEFNKAGSLGMESPMKDSPLYSLFFGHMGQYLSEKK